MKLLLTAIFILCLTACTPTMPNSNSNELEQSDVSSEGMVSDGEQAPTQQFSSQPWGQKLNYQMELLKVKLPRITPELMTVASSYENKLLLTYQTPVDKTTGNTAFYDLDTHTETVLPFYASELRMDETNYYAASYAIAGEGITLVKKIDKKSNCEEILYQTSNGKQLAPRLSCGNGYLVWAEYIPDAETINGFEIWAYDIAKKEAFKVAERCFGTLLYPYIINNGHLAYYTTTTDVSVANWSYLMVGYDLDKRKIAFEQPNKSVPRCVAFDGTYFTWSNATTTDLGTDAYETLYLTRTEDMEVKKIDSSVVGVDILHGEYLVYCKENEVQVYSISKDKVIFSSNDAPELKEEGYMLLDWFMVDHESKKATFWYAAGDDGSSEYIMVLNFT